ncbi:MAG: hypothetical protein PHN42_01585 [Bacilli bacterium]|nr:hypothetical protein [Bacilli bacterium]
MILRKPFAILIKHFKLIHFILMLLMMYVLYSTNAILSFINEYMKTTTYLIDHEVVLKLFNNSIYISIFFIFLMSVVILFLMAFKKKKIKFYLFNLAIYIYMIVVFVIVHNVLSSLEINLVDLKTLKMVQDLTVSSVISQGAVLLYVAIRATGFDIKTFNFVKDLEELDIEEQDNEEFEVNIDVDTDKARRKFRKITRYIKYIYVENKYIFSIGILLLIASICAGIYLNINVYNKTFKENTAFTTSEFIINIKDTYLTSTDYYSNEIDDKYHFVVVKYNIKKFSNKDKFMKNVSLVLEMNDHIFYNESKYKIEFSDFGNIYNEDLLSTNFNTYIMVYKIPDSYIDDKMQIKYYDINRKVITVDINPEDLTKQKEIITSNLKEEVNLSESILDNSIFKIESYELSDVFKNSYKFCATSDTCYDSYEYIRPGLNSNEDKILIKLVGNFILDENLVINKITTLYGFIKRFGSLTYKIGDVTNKVSLNASEIKPINTYDTMTSYIEVPKELNEAESIILNVNIRNKMYNYILK